MPLPSRLIHAFWCLWALYWLVAARGVKATERRESGLSRVAHLGPLFLAGWLLGASRLPGGFLMGRMFPVSWPLVAAGALGVALGLGFSVWARVHLGRNWSGIVTVKRDHELIRSGPYGWVRHPIYTGLLLAFLGSALALGEWRGLLATPLAAAALWRKLRVEERWMRERFGAAYEIYQREVPALVPFLR